MTFVNLKNTTEFSITESINKVDELVGKAADYGMPALAIADKNGLFGAIKFYKAAKNAGVKPILGINASIESSSLKDSNGAPLIYNLTLLAKNQNGYKKLIELNTRAYVENRGEGSNNSANMKEEWLIELIEGDESNIVILSGGQKGLIGQLIANNDLETAYAAAEEMGEAFGSDFYIELERNGSSFETEYMEHAVAMCAKFNLQPVAVHQNFFINQEDFLAHETRYCVSSKEILYDINREQKFNKEMYFKSPAEIEELFSDLPVAIENTEIIARKCNIDLKLDEPELPVFPTPNGMSVNDYFRHVAREGLEQRMITNFPNAKERAEKMPEYSKRLEWELDIIEGMKFPGYFLIVYDFINYAKSKDIPVGPGRGSGAGSLVAYSMKITDLDPLPYNLLFERFLNPERVSMPDFDIDFCQSRRGEVYEYVRHKYGEAAVSQIGTFGTMAAKAAIRDVGRALGHNYNYIDNIAKNINIAPNKPVDLGTYIFGNESKEIQPNETLLNLYNTDREVKKLIDISLRLEGTTKQVGTHAAGVVIAPTLISDYAPMYTPEKYASPSTQFDKYDVETAGLVKFDFLGLRNLTIIKEAVDLANKKISILAQREGVEPKLLNIDRIDIKNDDVYQDIYAKGNTGSIFQFEGKGMTRILMKANPTCLEDLIAINALYRPGPMDIIPAWLEAKNQPEEQRPYPHPKLREVLKETYSFMIYQEQVMQAARIMAGYSLGGADMLRRAMGKKDVKKMAEERAKFIDGCAEHSGVAADKAGELFDLIEKFAGYGFNKSHAAAYSYLSYQTAYLKQYYKTEFFTATLNSYTEPLDHERIYTILEDMKKNQVKILPPDINSSFPKFSIEDEGVVRFGFNAIKSTTTAVIEKLVEEREKNGPYVSFIDVFERNKGSLNKPTALALIRSGAFDSFEPNRAKLVASRDIFLDYTKKLKKKEDNESDIGVLGDLTDLLGIEAAPVKKKRKSKPIEIVVPELVDTPDWDQLTKANAEKTAFGYYLTINPYRTHYLKLLGGFEASTPLAEIKGQFIDEGTQYFLVGGLIEEIFQFKGKNMGRIKLNDGSSSFDITIFENDWVANKQNLKTNRFLSMKIRLQERMNPSSGELEISAAAMSVHSFEDIYTRTINNLFVGIENDDSLIDKFNELCGKHAGSVEDQDPIAVLCLPNEINGRKNKRHSQYYLKVSDAIIKEFKESFGDNNVIPTFKKELDNIVFPVINKGNGNKKFNNYSQPNNNRRRGFSA